MTGGIPPISLSWCRAPRDSQPEFFSQLNTCSHSPYITSSLTRGWVCHLQLLLALASAFILGSDSHGTRDHILLSQVQDFPFRCLLQLAGLRWRYMTPLHTGIYGSCLVLACLLLNEKGSIKKRMGNTAIHHLRF
jgi:hypothetical protein